jgi:hypothetical protein
LLLTPELPTRDVERSADREANVDQPTVPGVMLGSSLF